MAFYTQVSTCIYKLEQDKLHTCDAVTPLHSFVLVVSGGLLSDGISHHCRESLCTKPFLSFAFLSFAVLSAEVFFLMKSHGIIMHQAIIFVSCLFLLTLACASARGIVLSLFVCVCVCVCVCVSASFLSSH